MIDERFARTAALLGAQTLEKLNKSTVLIIGVGAVGGYALEGLARAGIGKFILVDFDKFETSNINRQILALSSTVGQDKVDVAKARVLDINPAAQVKTLKTFVNDDTIPEIMALDFDFAIDAIDALNPKCNLIEALLTKGVPFISSMGAALKTDTSHIKISKLSKTEHCSLSKFVRKRLKKRGVDIAKIRCVYSDEQTELPDTAIFENEDENNDGKGRKRNTLGSLPTITAIFGLTIANEAIKTLGEANA